MVVMWCKECGALIGLRQPLVEWSTDRTVSCKSCGGSSHELTQSSTAESPAADNATGKTADDIKASETTDDCPPLTPP
jgi:hypothetical protein